MNLNARRFTTITFCLAGAAFAVRLALRLWSGEAEFLGHGYYIYIAVARTWLAGDGFCTAPGTQCALRLPVYPLFLAPFIAAGQLYPGVPIAQAFMGAAMVWPAALLGRRWFGDVAGLMAGAMTAFSPYAVVHDTALQETCLVNFLVLSGLWLLIVGADPNRWRPWTLAGGAVAFALATLTTARVAFVLAAAAIWIVAISLGGRKMWRPIALVGAPMILLVGIWFLRNLLVVGAPVFTSESGVSLWVANSPVTMKYFPHASIDLVTIESQATLSAAQLNELAAAGTDSIAIDRVRARWGVAYMFERPIETLQRMLRKVAVVVGAELSPARGPLIQAGYTGVYGTLQVLAIVGLWQTRRNWAEHSLTWLVLIGLLAMTAVFWAHTSHRSVIDAPLFVYAAGALDRLRMTHPFGGAIRLSP